MNNIHTSGALIALSLIIQSMPVQADLNNSIYVPVEPCRVGDTRGTGTTKITAGSNVEWLAYGADMSAQGGAGSPGCPQPKTDMKPIGVALNVTVVGNLATGNGNVVAYPADGAIPSASLVNYKPGTNIANSTIVGLCQDGACDGKFKLQSNNSDVPVIADVQGYFYPSPGNIANVALSGGDYTSPVDAMADVANWCGTPSTTNRCLVKIAPGTYDLGSNQVVMQEWVSIQGAGQKATKVTITGAVSAVTADATAAVVVGVNNASLTDLTIENAGTGTHLIAIHNASASPRMERVTANCLGGTNRCIGVRNFTSSPIMTNIIASGSGGSGNRGVVNVASSSPVMTNVSATASGGTGSNHGVLNKNSGALTMIDVTATASGGVNGKGVYNLTDASPTSSPSMTNVVAKASGGSNSNFGVDNLASSALIQNSTMDGSSKGLRIPLDSSGTRVANSKIIGGVTDLAPATVNCRGNFDANLVDVNCVDP